MHTITDEQRRYLSTLTLQERQQEILKEEYLNGEWYAADITGVRPEDVPEADCYCFGFPCQAFSIAGNRRGFEDARGTLFFEVMRIAKERQPQILFAENVAGLLNHKGGVTFDVIINTMADLGYFVEWQVLNSRYFGVPQNRERVFIVGHLGDRSGRQVFPIATDDTTSNQLQGHESIVSNTLARGDRKSVGIADFRHDEGIRVREDAISPCLCSSQNGRDLSTSILLIEVINENQELNNNGLLGSF